MNVIEIFLIAVSLSMDAFAVSLCKGLIIDKIHLKDILIISISFGTFQFIMPIIGFFLGGTFSYFIKKFDHWISFIILTLIGCNMLNEQNTESNNKTDIKTMLLLSIATSIDALAVGITFAFLNVNIIKSSLIIGLTTFIISSLGVILSNYFKDSLKIKANIIGGITLIIIGIRILLEGIL